MITTKGSKGADKAQKATISYDGYYGIKKLARMPEFMDANEFMDYRLPDIPRLMERTTMAQAARVWMLKDIHITSSRIPT